MEVEGNQYFPPESIKREYFQPSDTSIGSKRESFETPTTELPTSGFNLATLVQNSILGRGGGHSVFTVIPCRRLISVICSGVSGSRSAPRLGAAWYITTFLVPALLVTHFMIFARLLKRGR